VSSTLSRWLSASSKVEDARTVSRPRIEGVPMAAGIEGVPRAAGIEGVRASVCVHACECVCVNVCKCVCVCVCTETVMDVLDTNCECEHNSGDRCCFSALLAYYYMYSSVLQSFILFPRIMICMCVCMYSCACVYVCNYVCI
jgi:hypothetical protein